MRRFWRIFKRKDPPLALTLNYSEQTGMTGMHFNIVTLFPEFFTSPLDAGLMSRAKDSALVSFSLYNPRCYSLDKHHKVDDRPFGGGPGMVMLLEPMLRCLRAVAAGEKPLDSVEAALSVSGCSPARVPESTPESTPGSTLESTPGTAPETVAELKNLEHSACEPGQPAGRKPGKILLLTPSGRPFNQAMARELAQEESLTIICGRYEGFDARLGELFELCPVSLGDFVLNGGESAALAIVESTARLLPGFMGHEDSGLEESFSNGLLEYPHYTRPELFEDSAPGPDLGAAPVVSLAVPEILRSGNHSAIAEWRHEQSLFKTLESRPDLLAEVALTAEEFDLLASRPRLQRGRNLHCALVHHPVMGKDGKSCTVSLTNLDIHDIARSSCTFGLGNFYVSTPLADQQRLLAEITGHWTKGAGSQANPDRANALSLVQGVSCLEEAVEHLHRQFGQKPLLVGTSAKVPSLKTKRRNKKRRYPDQISFTGAAELLLRQPVLLVFGTGHGLHPELLENFDFMLPPVRPVGYNHLSVRSAVAIVLDRILGDWL